MTCPNRDLKTEKLQIVASKDWVDRVDDYSFENRIRSRGETIRRLVDQALAEDHLQKKKGEAPAC